MATPTIEDSASGVSMTRFSPNSSRNPAVARNTPPRAPTSSPRTNARSSAFMASHSVSWTVWTMFFSVNCSPPRSPAFSRPPTSQGVRRSLRSLRSLGLLPPWTPCGRLGEDVLQGTVGRGVLRAPGLVHRPVDLSLDLGAQPLDRVVVQDSLFLQVAPEHQDGVVALGLLDLLARAVGAVVIVGGVGMEPVRL